MDHVKDLLIYQKLAVRTMNPDTDTLDGCDNYILGLIGEIGELSDLIKKVLFHGHPLDAASIMKIRDEIGDVAWYVNAIATEFSLELDTAYAFVRLIVPRQDKTMSQICRDMSKATGSIDRSIDIARSRNNEGSLQAGTRFVQHHLGIILENLDLLCGHFQGLFTLNQALNENINKLQARYPEKFTSQASINRAV